jgi:flavin reductase (DIM6/NTAB) family NADH-FMN oxidoreductase RutF
MIYDMRTLAADKRYKILASTIVPRPIAWVTTRDAAGVINAAPYSFFNAMGHEPPVVVLGILAHAEGRLKDTAQNIVDTGEFVVNLVPERLAEAMNVTCADAPPEVDETRLAGLALADSEVVGPPRLAQSPVSFECRTHTLLRVGTEQVIVVGEVQIAHVADEILLDPDLCHVDTPKMELIGRMHGSGWYVRTGDLFHMARPTYAELVRAGET